MQRENERLNESNHYVALAYEILDANRGIESALASHVLACAARSLGDTSVEVPEISREQFVSWLSLLGQLVDLARQ